MPSALEVENLLVRLTGDGSSFLRMVQIVETKTALLGQRLRTIGMAMSMYITAPLTIIGGLAVKTFADFDQAMANSLSIMKTTADQVAAMRQQAISLSTAGPQGPEALARSFFYLASAGKNAEQAMRLLPQVQKFATAGAFDMARATDLLTDAQSALGLSSKNAQQDEKNMARLADVLARANELANTSIEQASEALTNEAGPALKAYNKDVEEGVAVLAAFADQGIKGQVAGSQFARVMRLMNKAALENAKQHERLGFSVFDSSGKMRNMADIIQNLEQVLDGLSDKEKTATLEALGFQARIQQAILPLIGTSENIRRYEAELRKAGGTTDRIAKLQMRGFGNQLKVLKNEITTAAISLGHALIPVMKALAETIRIALSAWHSMGSTMQSVVAITGAVVAGFGPMLTVLGFLMSSVGKSIMIIRSLIFSMRALQIASLAVKTGLVIGVIATLAAMAFAASGGTRQMARLNHMIDETRRKTDALAESTRKANAESLAGALHGSAQQRSESLSKLAEQQDSQVRKLEAGLRKWETELASRQQQKGMFGSSARVKYAQAQIESQRRLLDQALEYQKRLQDELAQVGGGPSVGTNVARAFGQISDAAGSFFELFRRRSASTAQDLRKFTDELRLQAQTIGMSADKAELFRLKMAGSTAEQVAEAQKLIDIKGKLEERNKLMEEGKRLAERFATPQQKATMEIERLNKMLDTGAISFDVYQSAVMEVRKQFDSATASLDRMNSRINASRAGSADAAEKMANYASALKALRRHGITGARTQAPAEIQAPPEIPGSRRLIPPGSEEAIQRGLAGIGNLFTKIIFAPEQPKAERGLGPLVGGLLAPVFGAVATRRPEAAVEQVKLLGDAVKWLEQIAKKQGVNINPAGLS